MKIIEILLAREEGDLVAGKRMIVSEDEAAELERAGYARIVDDAPDVVDTVPLTPSSPPAEPARVIDAGPASPRPFRGASRATAGATVEPVPESEVPAAVRDAEEKPAE